MTPRSYNGTACRGGRYFIIDTLSPAMREENRYLSKLRDESVDTSRWEKRINVAGNLIDSRPRVASTGISMRARRRFLRGARNICSRRMDEMKGERRVAAARY